MISDLVREIEIEKELFRREAREDFRSFIAYTMPDYQFNWHHIHLIRKLEAFQRGEIRRLMVFMPPRHGKSQLVSRHLPAWIFGQNPDAKIIACSYSSGLATEMSLSVQRIMVSDEYKDLFFGTRIRETRSATQDQSRRTSDLFDIVGQKGHYLSSGVGGPITGKGANCFPAGTMIMTNKGEINIKDIYIRPFAYKVLSYNHENKKLEYNEVQAVKSRKTIRLHRITTTGGRVVESTPDHRFYAGGEYREANTLTPGQSLVCLVRGRGNETGIPIPEVAENELQRPLLQQEMLSTTPCHQKQFRLPKMWGVSQKRKQILLRLPSNSTKRNRRTKSDRKGQRLLSNLRKRISINKFANAHIKKRGGSRKLLQQSLRKRSTQQKDSRYIKSKLEGWNRSIHSGVQADNIPKNKTERWIEVCHLWQPRRFKLPPYRRKPKKQRSQQFSNTLQETSYYSPQIGKGSVSMVEGVCKKEGVEVYDIQVAENHNFFANGILVHNCVIIDDPIKNQQEAESPTYRENVWNWYTSTLYTRLEKDAGLLLTQTRWHEDDLAGRLLKQMEDKDNEFAEQWEVVDFPAIKITDENPDDPRKIGEALWPDKYDEKRLGVMKSTLGTRYWNALYDQKPVVEGGNIIKEEWFRTYQKGHIDPPTINFYLDSAFTNKTQNDPSAIMAYFELNNNLYIWHSKTIRMGFVELVAFLQEYIKSYGSRAGYLKVEPKASGLDIIDYLRRETDLTVIEDDPPKDSKVTRVYAATPYMEGGRVLVPEGETWISDFMAEMKAFPAGKHDDQVDCLTGAIKDTIRDEGIFMVGWSR